MKTTSGRHLIEPSQLRFRLIILFCILTVTTVGMFIFARIQPLIVDFRYFVEAPEPNTRFFLIRATRLALMSGNLAELNAYILEATRLPHIQGIVVADKDNQIVTGTWLGERLSDIEALKKMMDRHWQRWPVEGDAGTIAFVNVAFDAAWHTRLARNIVDIGIVTIVGILILAVLASLFARDRLAQKVTALNQATARIANGDYSVRVPTWGRGPVAKLGQSFNHMALQLDRFTNKVRKSEERFELAVNGSNDGIWDWNIQNNRLYLSPRFKKILGYGENELPGLFNAWKRLIHPQDEPQVIKAIDDHIGHSIPFRCELRLKTKQGEWLWMLGRGEAVRDKTGTAIRMAGSYTDISELKATEHALALEKERVQVTLQSIGDGVITTDVEGRIVYMNPTAERLTGRSCDDAEHRPIESILKVLDEFGASSIANSVKKALNEEQAATDLGQAALLSVSGERYIVEHNIAPLRDKTQKVIGGVLVVHNVTDRHKLMKQLSYQATHDSLTQLINRIGFELRLDKTLKSAMLNSGMQHVVCYMDLDQFKIVNDTCGHSAGDELLRQISVLLKQQVRKDDTLARLGGDEFGLLLESCPMDKAVDITRKLQQQVESFRFVWEDKTFSVGISIGVAPVDGSPGSSVAKILSTVDQACYIAKSKGRNQLHIYQPGDDESSRWNKEMQWVPHIHRALDEGQFILFAQPIVSIGSGEKKCGHYEILLRMKDKNGNLIAPGSFLPAAERYGLMPTLDRWVVGKAIDVLAEAFWDDSSFSISTFGINISGAVLSDNSLLKFVKHALDAHGLPPSLLCFEITETVAIANFSHASRFVNELKEMGCRFALDDFGSGFASFSYLKTLSVDYLKIDGSFVRHLTRNPVDQTMVQVINQLGHVMGLKTIAEFVETQEVLEALHEFGVDYAQGYYIGKPTPLRDVC